MKGFILANVLKDIINFIVGIKSASCRVKGAICDRFHAVRSQPDAVPVRIYYESISFGLDQCVKRTTQPWALAYIWLLFE